MPVTVEQMAQAWKRRQAARADRAAARAARLRSCLPEAKRILIGGHGAARVWLFGSLAAGTQHEESDVDLGVEGLPAARYFQALADLMALFDGGVDLVRVEEASASLRDRIFAEGQPL